MNGIGAKRQPAPHLDTGVALPVSNSPCSARIQSPGVADWPWDGYRVAINAVDAVKQGPTSRRESAKGSLRRNTESPGEVGEGGALERNPERNDLTG